jgi:two-component system, OmpR family, phosphate regulon response regulator OmpR
MNILLVDDNPGIRENTADWLRSRGHTVVAVPCAFAARDLVKSGFHVDAMIIDLQLPCGQGGLIIDWLSKGGAGDVPVVVWTAKRAVEEELPGFRIVYKPCPNEELEAAVLEVAKKKKTVTPRCSVPNT